ncbi:MAG: hypothetical protein JRG74_03340 [Deltaproteobacteria bacterium]|nr:hypothetical protein [Deltaproteobacteria bacterium]MBW2165155.1 hypothetical protein [Deltaproteobacteria bacterium]
MNLQQNKGEITIYQTEDGQMSLEVNLVEDTVWLSLKHMVALFDRDKSVISRHIKNIFREGELDKRSVVAKYGRNYALQGWQKHKINPDFIFTATASEEKDDYEQVYVVETKGLHLMGSSDTDYKQKMFFLCTREAKSRSRSDLGLAIKDKVLRFDTGTAPIKLEEIADAKFFARYIALH